MRREGAPLRLDDQILAVDQRTVEVERRPGFDSASFSGGAITAREPYLDRARAYASVASGRGSSHHGGAEIR